MYYQSSKLNKMVLEAGVEWPSKLQAAVLAANTCWKRSTNFTPSFLMYGREANSAHLLELLPFSDDRDDDPQICSDSGNRDNDWIAPLMDNRAESIIQAHDNIQFEQVKQKCVFDKKVKKNR